LANKQEIERIVEPEGIRHRATWLTAEIRELETNFEAQRTNAHDCAAESDACTKTIDKVAVETVLDTSTPKVLRIRGLREEPETCSPFVNESTGTKVTSYRPACPRASVVAQL
jgi:hypothetical protein